MILKIYIENELIDLYNDESIELQSSVANTIDISKNNTDYTKAFTVPASDNNNRIFKHYYNADIDNTFDARVKKNARIELDGLPFRTGKMRLIKVSVKSGEPSSYTINFWGNLVSLVALLKDDELSDLDLTSFDHPYNYSFVTLGLTISTGNLIYNLLSNRRQFMYSSDPANNTNTDKLVNIAYNGEDRGIGWYELKPSLRLLAIVEAIEAKYGLTFSRDFFGRTEFKELYMWLNNDDGSNYTEQLINYTSGDAGDLAYNFSTDTWAIATFPGDSLKYRVTITPETGYENVPYKIIVKSNNSDPVLNVEATGTFVTDFVDAPAPPFSLQFFVAASAQFQYQSDLALRADTGAVTFERGGHAPVNTVTDLFDVSAAMPKLKVMDFLKGLFNMFKLVAIPDNTGFVYVNNIDDYYREGTVYDVSKWVDWESYDVDRGNILSTLSYKYQEPTTLLNAQFKANTGLAYGDETISLADDAGEPLDGDSLEITLPFEMVYFERLIDVYADTKTNVQYGLITDDDIKPVKPKAVIFYNNRVSVSPSPISILNNAGVTQQYTGLINTPAHVLNLNSPTDSILWGPEFSTWNSAQIDNTLFKKYWSNYVSSIFNIKKRNFRFKAKLPIWMLTKLRLNDILFIKDRYYRINDFGVNLTTGAASLNLMNTFEANFGLFAPGQSKVELTYEAQSFSVYVSNGAVLNVTNVDAGSGTGWATTTQDGYNIVITVTENTGDDRVMYLMVDNGAGKEFQIYLKQSEE